MGNIREQVINFIKNNYENIVNCKIREDWPEYELVRALIEARVASEGSFDAQAKIKKMYYEALSVLHGLAGRTEKPASSENTEIVKHWYLVCWKSVNGLEGNTEIWFDLPWRKGDLVLAIRHIEALNTKKKPRVYRILPIA